MIAAGVNAKALQTFMGHASITVTLDLYGHLLPGSEDEAAVLLDGYLQREQARAPAAIPICGEAAGKATVGSSGVQRSRASLRMQAASTPTLRKSQQRRHFGAAERRRNRTYQPPGCDGLPVLKTGWGTSPVPLRPEG